MRILTIITIMKIIGASPEVIDPIEDRIWDIPLEVKNFCGRGQRNQNTYQGQYQNDGYQSNNYQGNPRRNFPQGNSYGQSRGRSHGRGRGNYCSCGHGRPNY